MAQIKRLMIVCGEASGDAHAAGLARAILEMSPGIRISGVGGELLRQSASEIYCDIKGLSVIGFFDALKKLPRFFSLRALILEKIKSEKPDAIILVDFSGFNLRLAKAINKSIPVIYYISPQVWASRPGRVKTIRKYIDKMLVFFKFEQEFYRRYAVEADFIGHPLLDIVRPTMGKDEFLAKYGLRKAQTTIALLPGSRNAEVQKILPIMLQSCAIISERLSGAQFIIAKSAQVEPGVFQRLTKGLGLGLKIIENETYNCLDAADFCLVASGTATLETAIMQKPFLVIYKMGLLNYLLYLPQVKVPFIGMVNIVAGKMIVPEFIQSRARPENIAAGALAILNDPSRIKIMREELGQVKSLLGDNGAASRAARVIADFLQHR
jgi:lipid-A-disaccharide synthase